MARACRYKHKLLGRGKATAYGIDTHGRRRRLTREQLRTGRLPDGVVEIVFTGPGHVSDHALTTDPNLLRLTPAQATALVNAGPRDHTTRTSAVPTEHTGTYTLAVTNDLGQDESYSARIAYDTYRIGGRTVTFGGIPGVAYDAEVIPRNPYVIARAAPDTPEGRKAALDYAYAHIALTEAADSHCDDCDYTQSCTRCSAWIRNRERAHLAPHDHLVPRRQTPPPNHRHTAVDALLLAATEGDPLAAAELQALATAGRAMVERARETPSRTMTRDRIEGYLRPYAQAMKELEAVRGTGGSRERELVAQLAEMRDELLQEWHQARDDARAALDESDATKEEIARLRAQDPTPDSPQDPTGELAAALLRHETLRARRERALEEEKHLDMIMKARGLGSACLDGEGLYLVHETAYDLEHDDAGNLLLRPRGDHTEDSLRDAVHFALNHAVKGHLWRGGGDAGRALVIDLKVLMEANPGALTTVFPVDTRVIPPPRQPIVIPAHAAKVIEYTDETPEQRYELVAQTLQEAGATVFESGMSNSDPTAEAIATVMAAYLGVGNLPHHSSGEHTNEVGLNEDPKVAGGITWAGPTLGMQEALALGDHGLARLFDRGGEPPYGRPAALLWSGASSERIREPKPEGATGMPYG